MAARMMVVFERDEFSFAAADDVGGDMEETLRAAGAANVERRGPANAEARGDCMFERIAVIARAMHVYLFSAERGGAEQR